MSGLNHSLNVGFKSAATFFRFAQKSNSTDFRLWLLFHRKITYHLANTYLPTLSLLAIVELTLFYGQDMGVSLSLTVLLVTYTFYQSISDSIPKTAYLKLMDYWLIFCLLIPFIIFLVQSYWCFCHENLSQGAMRVGPVDKGKSSGKKPPRRKVVQVMIVSLTAIFIFAYSLTAASTFYSYKEIPDRETPTPA